MAIIASYIGGIQYFGIPWPDIDYIESFKVNCVFFIVGFYFHGFTAQRKFYEHSISLFYFSDI